MISEMISGFGKTREMIDNDGNDRVEFENDSEIFYDDVLRILVMHSTFLW